MSAKAHRTREYLEDVLSTTLRKLLVLAVVVIAVYLIVEGLLAAGAAGL